MLDQQFVTEVLDGQACLPEWWRTINSLSWMILGKIAFNR